MDEPTLSSSEADAHIESTATEISLQSEIDTVKPEVVKGESIVQSIVSLVLTHACRGRADGSG